MAGLCLLAGTALAADALTPGQVAYVEAQTRKADAHFVHTVAYLAGRPESVIRKAMPTEGRIADPAGRVIAVLEAERKEPLPEDLRNQITAAEAVRRMSIANAREAAARR
jgi:hypothetical protein